MAPKPFRFGICLRYNATAQEWRLKAHKAEDLGYSTFLAADHVWIFPPIVGMLAAAEATTSLRIGSYVLGNDYRHPALLASEMAAIDLMSNGRLEFGLGSGYHPTDYQKLGINLDAPGVRVSRLEEAVQVIKGLWSGKLFSFTGSYYSIDNLESIPQPIQQPHPPLLIGGGGKRVLSIAAREADIVGILFKGPTEGGPAYPFLSPEATAQQVEWVREAAGPRFNDLELSLFIPFAAVTDHRRSGAELVAEHYRKRGLDATTEQLLGTPHALFGSVDQIVADLQERRGRYGISYYAIVEDHLEAFAPVIARLAGT
jgi:probable F420-dependent oxidoreductase